MILARTFIAIQNTAKQIGVWRFVSRGPMAKWIDSLSPLYIHWVRRAIAARHLRGDGIEIGALHMPLRVRRRVKVKYVDKMSYEQLLRLHPELLKFKITAPDIIDDGFSLNSIADLSQDFVIANHVLEHSPSPLRVLLNWTRVLRGNGVLFLTVPIHSNWMDREREVTPVAHIIEDYSIFNAGDVIRFRERNRLHYVEWHRTGLQNIYRSTGQDAPSLPVEELEARIEANLEALSDIHFHTFSKKSFSDMICYFCANIDPSARLEELCESGAEIIAVIKKINASSAYTPAS